MTNVPVLGLRMKHNVRIVSMDSPIECDLVDKVQLMALQDSMSYKCSDYLTRRAKDAATNHEKACCTEEDCPMRLSEEMVDAVCREKMCEWSYRVCDHFCTGREIVAVAFSYLDRFVDRCNCDRTAFKLATMTSLYMATKIFNTPKVGLQNLVELSRGEFEGPHILEMEKMMLQILEWRVHPPTIQCFIEPFCAVLPEINHRVTACVKQRAIFFAELALYDYNFVSKEKALIAVAAILNAIEGLEDGPSIEIKQSSVLSTLEKTFEMKFQEEKIESMRHRLWYVYSMSAQYQEDEVMAHHETPDFLDKKSPGRDFARPTLDHSPVCVTSR